MTRCDAHGRCAFTGTVGLPRIRGAGGPGFSEYLPQYWRIGATTCYLNTGGGRFKLDTGGVDASLFITGAASSAEASIDSFCGSALARMPSAFPRARLPRRISPARPRPSTC